MEIIECSHDTAYCILCDKIKNNHYKQAIFEIQKKDSSIFLCNQCLMELASKLVPFYEYQKTCRRIEKLANDLDKQIRRAKNKCPE